MELDQVAWKDSSIQSPQDRREEKLCVTFMKFTSKYVLDCQSVIVNIQKVPGWLLTL